MIDAVCTVDGRTITAVKKLLSRVRRTEGDRNLVGLAHHILQLVYQEGWRKGCHSSIGDANEISTNRATESHNPCLSGNNPLETKKTDGVGAGQQFGKMFRG